MSDPAQTSLTDRMIARLEEANTRSYKQLKGAGESSSRPEQNTGHHPPDKQPARERRPSRAGLWLFACTGLALAASVYVTAFVWRPSYGDAAKSVVAQWVNASVPLQPPRHNDAILETVISPEIDRRLQKMADELAAAQRQIGQLKVGQDEINRISAILAEQSKAGQEQLARDNAKVVDELSAAVAKMAHREEALDIQKATERAAAQQQIKQLKARQDELNQNVAMLAEQFKADREQMARDNAKVVDEFNAAVAKIARLEEAAAKQLKATQEQLGEAAPSRSVKPARNLRRKRLHRRSAAH